MKKNVMVIVAFVVFGIITFLPKEVQADVTQTGTWGEVTWEFDSATGELTFTGTGNLGEYDTSPWNQTTDPVTPTSVTKIIFQQEVIAPKDSVGLFGDSTSSNNRNYLINLTSIVGLSNLNTSEVISMNYMFAGCSSLISIDLANFDTTSVSDMTGIFRDCSSLIDLDLSIFDTSNVTNMLSMFTSCSSLTSLNLSNFNTSKVQNMEYMFSACTNLTTVELSSFDTSNVRSMYAMFAMCQNLISFDVSQFDTSNVTDMSWMFSNCYNLLVLDLSNFDTSKVTSMSSMFTDCTKLQTLNISSFNTLNVITSDILGHNKKSGMFSNNTALSTIKLGSTTLIDNTNLPLIDTTSGEYTGRWTLVLDKSRTSQTNIYESSTTFMSDYDGTIPGTYVWEMNQQSITASNYTMYVGDPPPTITDFEASAIDKGGNASEVTVDLSTADLTKAGTYSVVITSADGQTVTVNLTILAKGETKPTTDPSDPEGTAKETAVSTSQNHTLPITGESNTFFIIVIGMMLSLGTIRTISKRNRI